MSYINNFLLLNERQGCFTLKEWDGLYFVDLETGICHCEDELVKEVTGKNIESLVTYKDYILMLPIGTNDKIEIYNIHDKKYVDSVKIGLAPGEYCYFDNVTVANGCLYLINNWSVNPAIYVLDMSIMKITKKVLLDKQKLWKYDEAGRLFSKDHIVENNILILSASAERCLVYINLYDYTVEYKIIDCHLNGFVAMCQNNHDYWFIDSDYMVLKWNPNGTCKEYDLRSKIKLNTDLTEKEASFRKKTHGYRMSYMCFNSIINIKDCIYFIPGRADKLLKWNIKTDILSVVCNRPGISGTSTWTIGPNVMNGRIFFFSVREHMLYIIGDRLNKLKLEYAVKDKKILLNNKICYEENVFPLSLQSLISNEFSSGLWQDTGMNEHDTYGKKIWELMT